MFNKLKPGTRSPRRLFGYILTGLFFLALLSFILVTHFEISDQFNGIFLLKGTGGAKFELKDDLYLNEGDRLLFALDLKDPRFIVYQMFNEHKPSDSYLYYEWDSKDGSGFVRNFLPGGKQILTCFGRYDDEAGKHVRGLFVGGGLSDDVEGDRPGSFNETGMAWYDGRRWYHIWCTANEDMESSPSMAQVFPSGWKYLGSKVLYSSDKALVIRSSHEVVINGVPLKVDRTASFRAGETYFVLSVKVTNAGKSATAFYHSYGDEPWLGSYGSSRGNVGWVKDSLIQYTCWLDTTKYSSAGFFDYGNDAIGEGHEFTMVADFIEWSGDITPEAFFSNSSYEYPYMDQHTPLASNSRYFCLHWGPEMLKPGQSTNHIMAIGMADHDPQTGFPVVPPVTLDKTR